MMRALILALVLLATPAAAQSPYYWLQPGYNPNIPQGWVAQPPPPGWGVPCGTCGQQQPYYQPQPQYQPQQPYYYQPQPSYQSSPYETQSYCEKYGRGGSDGCVYGCACE